MTTVVDNEKTIPPSIAKKLGQVSKIINDPQRSGYLSQFKFNYSNRDDVARVVRPALNEVGLLIRPVPDSFEILPIEGSKNKHYTVTMKMFLIDADNGATWCETCIGEAVDASDKGIAKAQTQAIRHWAINTFWLCDGGEEHLYNDNESVQPARVVLSPQEKKEIQEVAVSNTELASRLFSIVKEKACVSNEVVNAFMKAALGGKHAEEIPSDRLKTMIDRVNEMTPDDLKNKANNFFAQFQKEGE